MDQNLEKLLFNTLSAVSLDECCPSAKKYLNGAVSGEAEQKLLKTMRREIKQWKKQNTDKIQYLQDELVKAEKYIKIKQKEMRVGPTAGSVFNDAVSAQAAKSGDSVGIINAQRPTAVSAVGSQDVVKDKSDSKVKRKRSTAATAADHKNDQGDDDDTDTLKRQRRQSTFLDESSRAETQEPDQVAGQAVAYSDQPPPKLKPSQQTPSNTFWNYVEQFFKLITEQDVQNLYLASQDDVSAFLIPPLGRHYREVWADGDNAMLPSQEHLQSGLGSLTERLLSALVEENIVAPELEPESSEGAELVTDQDGLHQKQIGTLPNDADFNYDVEERIRRELQHLGLLDLNSDANNGPHWSNDEDDEICLELRRLQQDLRQVHQLNQNRRRILEQVAQDRMAYQEYLQVVEDLNKQIESHYSKLYKNGVRNKRKRPIDGLVLENLHDLLEKRRSLTQELAPIFPHSQFRISCDSLFHDDASLLKNIIVQPSKDIIMTRSDQMRKKQTGSASIMELDNVGFKSVISSNQ
ncbi:hypothetical protein MIR68_012532 [Amoeboaphelidium protococcarum]|nr:hypothetical protein MIR68_012532 [Amoeboaphelidium protococcarum]